MSEQTFGVNTKVHLVGDQSFVGYVFGQYVNHDGTDSGLLMVSVSKPGSTELRGCVRIPREKLIVAGAHGS